MTKNELLISRIFISLFWVFVVAAFLLAPQLLTLFESQKNLNIFAPALVLDPESLIAFEKETGIHVSITYFDSSSALLNKMDITKGLGYDIIIADDHAISVLQQKKLLKKIDTTQFSFYSDISPWLVNNYYDPLNEYAVPYYWTVYGLGYDQSYFKEDPLQSWKLLFDSCVSPSYIGMTDDAREAVMFAAFYMYGTTESLKNKDDQEAVVSLLREQKKRVVAYTIQLADRLLQMRSVPVAPLTSADWWRLHCVAPHVGWFIPKEGSFITIDSLVIPKTTSKDAYINQLIEYIFRPEVIAHQCAMFGSCSPRQSVKLPDQEYMCSGLEQREKIDFFQNPITEGEINDLWISVLAS